ncbi:MAG: hypothetical protein JO270_12735 [Acidobacteriaceae bacterium]|nr:hypothetical protein [Acidobacteriaceae bacterium]
MKQPWILPLLLWLIGVQVTVAKDAGADAIGALIRGNRWSEAEAAAARYADPVAPKLVIYYRLLGPATASSGEIRPSCAEPWLARSGRPRAA